MFDGDHQISQRKVRQAPDIANDSGQATQAIQPGLGEPVVLGAGHHPNRDLLFKMLGPCQPAQGQVGQGRVGGRKTDPVPGRQLAALQPSDAAAQQALCTLTEHLADGISNVIAVLNPQAVILGGGIMAQQDYLRPRILQRLEELVVPAMRINTQLTFAQLGNDAGMIGALYRLLQQEA